MEIKGKSIDGGISLSSYKGIEQHTKTKKQVLKEEDAVKFEESRKIEKIEDEKSEETANADKVSRLKNEYESGSLSYNSEDVAKAFLTQI